MSEITVYKPHPHLLEARADMTGREREEIHTESRAHAAGIGLSVHTSREKAVGVARLTTRHLREDLADARQRRSQIEAKKKLAERGSRSKAWLYRIAGIISAGAEFVLIWSVLPWAFGIRQHSFLGFCAAAAPVAGIVLVKETLERLIRPAYAALLASKREWTSLVLIATEMVYLLIVTGVVGLAMVTHIAGTRELAIEISQVLGSGEVTELTADHKTMLARTVLVIAVFVNLASGSLLAYANLYAWAAKLGRQAKADWKAIEAECRRLLDSLRKAELAQIHPEVDSRYATACAQNEEQKWAAVQGIYLERHGRRPVERPPAPEEPAPTLESVGARLTRLALERAALPRKGPRTNGHAA